MTLTNFDSSLLSLKKSQKALYAWKNNNDALVNLGRSVLQEQPTYQSANVVAMRKRGECVCLKDSSENPYDFNGLSRGGGNWQWCAFSKKARKNVKKVAVYNTFFWIY